MQYSETNKPGLADPSWYEWSVGQQYIIDMLNDDNKIKSVGDEPECEIEDLFSKEVLATTLNGKTFDRDSNADNSQHYVKRIFAEHIYNHYKEIDFNSFIPLLDTIRSIVVQEGN